MTTKTELVKVTVEGRGYSRFLNEKRTTIILSNGEEMTLAECLRVIGNEGICNWKEVDNMKKRVLNSKIKFISKYENELVSYTKTYLN